MLNTRGSEGNRGKSRRVERHGGVVVQRSTALSMCFCVEDQVVYEWSSPLHLPAYENNRVLRALRTRPHRLSGPVDPSLNPKPKHSGRSVASPTSHLGQQPSVPERAEQRAASSSRSAISKDTPGETNDVCGYRLRQPSSSRGGLVTRHGARG